MKSTGVVRKLDNLGRIVIPIELRKTMPIRTESSAWKATYPLYLGVVEVDVVVVVSLCEVVLSVVLSSLM